MQDDEDAGPADEAATGPAASALRRKAFLDRAVERSGVGRKADARAAVDAALAVLGEVLAEGRAVNLPPLGKLKVTRVKEGPRGRQLVLRLVRPPARSGLGRGLAEPEEAV